MSNHSATPTTEQASALALAFDYLNERLFQGAIPRPMISFRRDPKIKGGGCFAPSRWVQDGEVVAELTINALDMAASNVTGVFAIMAHEMTHAWQHANGKPSRDGYHNKEWLSKAREIGLETHGDPYALTTSLAEDGALLDALAEMPEDAIYPWESMLQAQEDEKDKSSARGRRSKFTCPSCGAAAWGKPTLRLVCGDCMLLMEPA